MGINQNSLTLHGVKYIYFCFEYILAPVILANSYLPPHNKNNIKMLKMNFEKKKWI